jgi:beta-glucosidase
MAFKKDFVWGTATASYQIEGAAKEDGKGKSVWDMMSHWDGKIYENNNGDVSCDHYHNYKQDVALMKEIGIKGYRCSISWPRVVPEGIGKVNEKGLDFYDKLVDELLANGIEPWVTLFHWDYPYSLFCKGGWLNNDSSNWFADYAKIIVDKLSDRVTKWMTLNEPQCFIGLGHQDAYHAPGLKLDFPEILLATHNVLLAHGKSVMAIRAGAKQKPMIGAAPVGITFMPFSNSTEDIEATRKAMFSITKKDCWNNTWFADAMIKGKYPEDGLKLFEEELPVFKTGDMKIIGQKLDFYGANIYHAERVKFNPEKGYDIIPFEKGHPWTTMDWKVVPEALYWGPKFLYERYKLPIVLTENGVAVTDWVALDGKVHDPQRVDFLKRYLREFEKATDDGVEALGYFIWTLIDNFEWAFGYKQRFGLIHVDFQTQKRTLKDSAYWYKKVIESNGNTIHE